MWVIILFYNELVADSFSLAITKPYRANRDKQIWFQTTLHTFRNPQVSMLFCVNIYSIKTVVHSNFETTDGLPNNVAYL